MALLVDANILGPFGQQEASQSISVVLALNSDAIQGTFTNSTIGATQSGSWTVAATQSGTWNIAQSGSWTVAATQSGTWSIAQSGSWTVAATQSGSWTQASTQSGTWNIRVQDGSGNALTSETVGSKQGLDTNQLGYTLVQTITLNYASTNVTTSAFTQLIASTSHVYQLFEIYDNSGSIMELAFGGSGSEVVQFSIPKGGNGQVRLYCAASTRISIKAVSANATSDYLVINLYG